MFPSSATAYSALEKFGQTRRKAPDIMKEAEAKYDIPGFTDRLSRLRSLVGNLTSSVEQVDPSVTGRTSGSLTTEAQRSALVNRERAPILGDLSKQQGALGREQEGFSLASSLADKYGSGLIQEDERSYQSLLDQYNAAQAAEQAAEAKRQFEENLKFQREQESRLAREGSKAGAGGIDMQKYLDQILAAVGGGGDNARYAEYARLRGIVDKNLSAIKKAAPVALPIPKKPAAWESVLSKINRYNPLSPGTFLR